MQTRAELVFEKVSRELEHWILSHSSVDYKEICFHYFLKHIFEIFRKKAFSANELLFFVSLKKKYLSK